ncbi:secretion protein HlyD family protein [Thalassoporum mexicanum PCC 7367]|uniref:HlyD family efflux transporter periplasmic adaptor subunit n=1 Tax=Thalassoporum mexicanum TaxID=3457544 RepID=UPI00029F8FC6|nr:HlyD family efflux transporter periplasmic adaptor subunit [Pseudanabaena sp. PCC 7367]AFY70888.1 secretion protein HlyD family protein [Pseudanabaena sp. PCC 7367]
MSTPKQTNGAGSISLPQNIPPSSALSPLRKLTPGATRLGQFDQPVTLEQSGQWSRSILWALLGVTTAAITWASIARIEEAVPAQGQLEPQGAVKEIESSVGGVVSAIHVVDGQEVAAGDLLVSLDTTVSSSQFDSLKQVKEIIEQESAYYEAKMDGVEPELSETASPRLRTLTINRDTLLRENRLLLAQLQGVTNGEFNPAEIQRLQAHQTDLNLRFKVANLEADQLAEQVEQTDIRIANLTKVRDINQELLDNLKPLLADGVVSRVQFIRQELEVQNIQAEIDQLQQEKQGLQVGIIRAKTTADSIMATASQNLLTEIAENSKRIAEIESDISREIVTNTREIAEIDSRITQTEQTIKYEEVRAPVAGKVFDLQPTSAGFVAAANEPILKLVPDETLIARVYISSQDIGFVEEGMSVDVRIDSFPFSEFGDVKGKVVFIGSDSLPPDQIRPFYSYPAHIELERQDIMIREKPVNLQSGMSLSVNILVRDRRVISLFTDLFINTTDGFKFVR